VLRIICGRSESLVTIELSTGEYLQATEEHEMWVEGRGWTSAAKISPGDRLLGAEGESVEVLEAWRDPMPAPVYNLHVEDAHTYFAAGVWVHNDNCPTLGEVMRLATSLRHADGQTVAGAALKKKVERAKARGVPTRWEAPPVGPGGLSPAAYNAHAEWQIMDIITAPGTRVIERKGGKGGWTFQEVGGRNRMFRYRFDQRGNPELMFDY
jgi:hypothetical protein